METYVDQEVVHLLGISLEPAIGVVGFAVCAEDVGVAVDDPGVDAEDDLDYVNILKVYIYGGGSRTPSGKYLPAMVIPSLGTTRGRLCETPGWKRYASFNYTTVRILKLFQRGSLTQAWRKGNLAASLY